MTQDLKEMYLFANDGENHTNNVKQLENMKKALEEKFQPTRLGVMVRIQIHQVTGRTYNTPRKSDKYNKKPTNTVASDVDMFRQRGNHRMKRSNLPSLQDPSAPADAAKIKKMLDGFKIPAAGEEISLEPATSR